MLIRKIQQEDSHLFLGMLKRLDAEQKFMMYEPDERKTTADEMRSRIESMSSSGSVIFVAEANKMIVGFLSAERGFARRINHTAYIVAGVLKDYSNLGIGTRLFEELEKWALESKITRLELTVLRHNDRALALYKKMGFTIEGIRKKSLWIDNQYFDEYYMAKFID